MTRSRRPIALVLTLGGALTLAAPGAYAQIRASERASVSQTIDGTTMTLDFARPRVRGRPTVFGPRRASIVHWGEVWTPGANYATTLDLNKAITLEGRQLAAGKYSLWLIPSEGGPWTMVFDPDHHRFHTEPPDSSAAQIRVPVRPTTGPFEEALSFSFSDLAVSSVNLNLAWGTTRVTMAARVTPSLRLTTPVDEAAPFLGRYEWRYTDGDSTKSWILTVRSENGYMRGVLAPVEEWPGDFAFIRLKPDREWFHLGIYDKGELYEIETTWVAEFTRGADGRVNGFVVRNDQDKIDVRAKKLP